MKDKVENNMSTEVVAALWSETLESAYNKMQTLSIRHLPVINDGGKLIGIISDRDIQRGMVIPAKETADFFPHAEFPSDAIVQEFMSTPVTSIDRTEDLAKAARLMIDEKISALVVLDKSRVTGIITHEDLLKVLVLILEEREHSLSRFADRVRLETPVGAISHLLAQAGI
ncbi:MAG TPA: CBS domain-containing protein [Bdellovibrionales bacterium]|jgi:acetoin utilization protein AcuB|nr:CBS domain-containing protein [Bdellovibrionales bacterium]